MNRKAKRSMGQLGASAAFCRQACVEMADGEPLAFVDGHDDAILGIADVEGEPRVVYDREAIIRALMRRDGIDREGAVEFFEYNIEGTASQGWVVLRVTPRKFFRPKDVSQEGGGVAKLPAEFGCRINHNGLYSSNTLGCSSARQTAVRWRSTVRHLNGGVMAISDSPFFESLSQCGGVSADGVKSLMMRADLTPAFNDAQAWGLLCKFVTELDEVHGFSEPFQRQFEQGEDPSFAMMDNYILGGLAAVRLGMHHNAPLIAAAAFNKHSFPGLRSEGVPEIALMRYLQWAGADVSMAGGDRGMTPLHYMSFVKHGRNSHPEAVRWLLSCGATVSARNASGDTPMAYLCGASVWREPQQQTFLALLDAGASPIEMSSDGSTPLSLLKTSQQHSPEPLRTSLIESLEADIARAAHSKSAGQVHWDFWASTLVQ